MPLSIFCREPKSMDCILARMVDDLLTGEKTGYSITDHSCSMDAPERNFKIKLILLLWIGDYPGQAKICNMKHAGAFGCHWCMQPFSQIGMPGYNLALNQRRLLPPAHRMRFSAEFNCVDIEPPPRLRTHEQTMKDGLASYTWQQGALFVIDNVCIYW